MKAALFGFLTGTAIPVGYGIYLMVHTTAYYASLPKAPNTAACGMPMLAAWVLILVGGPIGALTGLAGAAIYRCFHPEQLH